MLVRAIAETIVGEIRIGGKTASQLSESIFLFHCFPP